MAVVKPDRTRKTAGTAARKRDAGVQPPSKGPRNSRPVAIVLGRKGSGKSGLMSNGILDYRALYRAEAMDRIDLIKAGVPATTVGRMARQLDISSDRFLRVLGLAPATVSRKVRAAEALAIEDGSRVVGIGRLIGQVAEMVEQSGRAAGFDAARWIAQWIERPVPALGNRRPDEFLDTAEGQALVSQLIARMQTGAYS